MADGRASSSTALPLPPLPQGLLIALGRPACGLLHAPFHPVHDQAHALERVGHSEVALDQDTHPLRGPALVGVAMRGRSRVEELVEQVQLVLGQAESGGRALGLQD